MKKNRKFYIVWIGRRPGIYGSWDECRKHVDGFSGALYRSFSTYEEAAREFENPSGRLVRSELFGEA